MSSLFTQALSMQTLREAWEKVKANRGCAGTDGETLEMFGRSLIDNLIKLRAEVLDRAYRPRPLLGVVMEEPGKKPRPLAIPSVRDRVLQTAVAMTLTPLFEAEFEDCSFAYRQGRSVDQVVRRIIRCRNEGYQWVVDADISSFFVEIDHGVLFTELRQLIKEQRLLDLIELWVKAEVADGNTVRTLTKGVPQGSPISPMLSNLYLDHLDEALLAEGLRILRFADDFLVLCKQRGRAEEALELTEDVLEALKLNLNRAKTRIVNFEQGFRFLGVQFIRSLVLKTRYPEIEEEVEKSLPHEDVPEPEAEPERSAPVPESGDMPPQSALALALAEALAKSPVDAFPETPLSEEEREAADKEASFGKEPFLRTLYLLEHGCTLGKQDERLVIRKQGEVIQEVQAIKVDQVMVFGNSQITSQAMAFCLLEKIPIVLLSGKGRYYGVVDSFDTDPVLLHRDQFVQAANPEFCVAVAKAIVQGKLANMRLILRRYARKRDAAQLGQMDGYLRGYIGNIERAQTVDEVRGYEGIVSKTYFEGMRQLLSADWGFERRVRQPPTDPINSLLSYGYTLLFYNVYALIRARGLNAHVGFLHALRSGHPALVSDLVEEFRSLVVDALVLSLTLNNRLTPNDFTMPSEPGEPCLLGDQARKQFIHAFENKMNSAVTHPATGLQLDYRRCIDQQVQIMAAVIRGKRERYMPMVLR